MQRGLWTTVVCLALAGFAAPAPASGPSRPPKPGDPMPELSLRYLGAPSVSPRWNTASDRPRAVLLVYWLAESERSRELLLEANDLFRDLVAAGVEVVTVTARPPGSPESRLLEVARSVKLDVPVLLDEGLAVSKVLGLQAAPAMVFAGQDGRLRVSGARHLRHEVSDGVRFEEYLRAGLEDKDWATVEAMLPYDPSTELVGRSYVDHTLPDLITLRPTALASLLGKDRRSVVVFWTVRSGRCTRFLAKLSDWYEEEGRSRVSLVTVAAAPDEPTRAITARFLSIQGIELPVLMDHKDEMKSLYRVATIPAAIVLGSDGRIETAVTAATGDVLETIRSIAP